MTLEEKMKINKSQKIIIFIIVLATFISGFVSGYVWKTRGIPFVGKKLTWSIGIYTGGSPLKFSPNNIRKNPVLTAQDITDVPASFVADPFMIQKSNRWYMFFEVMNNNTTKGDIGLAISNDGINWKYQQIVLDESFHLSYPYVFEWGGEYYMIPETHEANSIRLYKAIDFPSKWLFETTLLKGNHFVDTSVIFFSGKWWLFTSIPQNDTLYLYYADKLIGPWIEHPKSPVIIGNKHVARPGGRVIVLNGKVYRYTQDDSPTYGNQLRAFEITELTTKNYKEEEVIGNPILKATGSGWNGKGMHQIDPHQINNGKWIACVDGIGESLVFGFEY